MDFSRLDRNRVLLGGAGAIAVLISLLLPWFSLTHTNTRIKDGAWVCGTYNYSCTGFETFPILRWLLIAGALSPLILAWIIVRGHKLSWPPGEMTMVVGSTMTILVFYNGILSRPGDTFGVGLDYGYALALLGSMAIAATGFLRSRAGQRQERKAPGTV